MCTRPLSSQPGKPWAAPSLTHVESVPLSTETGLAHLPPSSQGLSRGSARSRGAPNGPSSKLPKGRALFNWQKAPPAFLQSILSPSHLRRRNPPGPLGSPRQSSAGTPESLRKAPLLPKTQLPICALRGFTWTTPEIPSGFNMAGIHHGKEGWPCDRGGH